MPDVHRRRALAFALLPGLGAGLAACSGTWDRVWNTAPEASRFYTLVGDFSPAAEVPPRRGPGRGMVQGRFDARVGELSWTARTSGLSGPITRAQLRGPAMSGSVGPLIAELPVADGSDFSGTLRLSQAEGTRLLGGLLYIELLTGAHPDGALRAQLAALLPAQ